MLGYGAMEEKKELNEKCYSDKTTQELSQDQGLGVFTKIEDSANTLKRILLLLIIIEYDYGDSYNPY